MVVEYLTDLTIAILFQNMGVCKSYIFLSCILVSTHAGEGVVFLFQGQEYYVHLI